MIRVASYETAFNEAEDQAFKWRKMLRTRSSFYASNN